jgi:hypothetical protein
VDRDVTRKQETPSGEARDARRHEDQCGGPDLARRALLQGMGRVAWSAPTLAVLGTLVPGSANAGSTVTECPPFPDPNQPGCG